MSGSRADALAGLAVFVGEWVMEAKFPGGEPASVGSPAKLPEARTRFEWALGGQFLLQRTEISIPEAPDSLAIVSTNLETGAYLQHYYDSRGVTRIYAMSLADDVWTLSRESPDFTPLDFQQRFTGTFSADKNTITGAWEKRLPNGDWEHDFTLNYRRVAR